MSNAEALTNVVVIVPVVRIWSGQVTIRRDQDLDTASGLPPKAIATDGGKRVIDPKALSDMETQRRDVNRYLAEVGVRSPMGYLIAPENEQAAYAELNRRQVKFNDARNALLMNYSKLCTDWETKNPGFEEFLRRNRPTQQEVETACSFGFAPYKVVPAESNVGQAQFAAVAKEATSSLVDDIAASAKTILTDSFDGKERITQRTVNNVRDLVKKLKGFSMFDRRIAPTAAALGKVLEGLPKTGPLETTEAMILGAMLNSMADATQLLQMGANLEQAQQTAPTTAPAATPAHQPVAAAPQPTTNAKTASFAF